MQAALYPFIAYITIFVLILPKTMFIQTYFLVDKELS